jgi:CheY-like chemotaxis protein
MRHMTLSHQEPVAPVNLLLVSEQPANLVVLEAILTDDAYRLVRASSHEQALRHLLTEDFAVVLLDLPASGWQGVATAQLIRGRERSRSTPIIFLAAYESPDFPLAQAFALGAVDYLVRPLLPVVLRAKVAGFAELFRKTEQLRRQEQREHEHLLLVEKQRAELRRWQERAGVPHPAVDRSFPEDGQSVGVGETTSALAPVLKGLQQLRLAGDDRLAAEQARQMIERQGQHLARLVEDLLVLLRLARDKEPLRRERLDLCQLVRDLAEERRPALEQAGLRLTLEVPGTRVWLAGDPARLSRALGVLLDNRARAPDGRGHVTLRLTADAGRRQVTITFHHSGMGVEPELLARLLDVFALAEAGFPPWPGSRGLGLALVRELLVLHGGEVRASSEGPGRGLEVTLRLPLEEEPLVLAAGVPAEMHPSAVRLRILVVEDNPESAECLRLLLNQMGHDVTAVLSGAEAVRLAAVWRPQLVLCDIGLPGMSGFEVCAALRRHPATARARLIAVTGFGEAADRRRCLEAGFDHHLSKPVDPHVLESMIALQTLVAHMHEGPTHAPEPAPPADADGAAPEPSD